MFLNNFSIRIPEGSEIPGGYVELRHSTQYTLVLRNNRNVRCDARVEIDGKHVGAWRLYGNQSFSIERPVNDTGRFTFYKAGTPESNKAAISENDPNLGLVKVTFTPEKIIEKPVYRSANPWGVVPSAASYNGMMGDTTTAKGLTAGGTGLSGQSTQMFSYAQEIEYDLTQQTVIHLRLVCKNGDEPRPLTAFSTPVPPLIR